MSFTSFQLSGSSDAALPTQLAATRRRVWTQLAAVVVSLAALARALPSPTSAWATMLGGAAAHSSATTASGAGRTAGLTAGVGDTAMLCLAAAAVWLLLCWVLLVIAAALAGRLPGVLGSAARAGLVAVAPVAVRNVVLTVVGASVVTGLAGCSTGMSGVPASAPQGPAVASSVATARDAAAPTVAGPSGSACMTTGAASQLRTERISTQQISTQQLRAEHVIGIATLRISDRPAVQGSALRSGGSASADGPATPNLDWPMAPNSPAAGGTPGPGGSAGSSGSGSSASSSSWAGSGQSAQAGQSRGTTTGRVAAATVSVDWPGPPVRSDPSEHSVVVLRGDSLWAIAARSLPPGADDADIDQTWRAWYAANTSVIGSDPDHLLPGQILRPPNTGTGTHR